jgi:hypothetical protein
MIFKKVLPRRAFLRGAGAGIALPFLDAMVPAMASAPAAPSPRRFAIVYAPNGAIMDKWTPPTEGALGDLPPILAPLQSVKDQLLVISGLESKEAWGIAGVDVAGEHPRASAAFLTGVHVYSATKEPKAGISIDQVIGQEFKNATELASLELGIESAEILGACDGGCTYTNTLCWKDANTPLPMENQPRAVFERLFGTSDTTSQQERAGRIEQSRTILDFVQQETSRLLRGLGNADQHRVDQYLDAIRDAERRIQMAEQRTSADLPTLQRPAGIPATVGEHIRLMMDLQTLAFQSDITRVTTLQIGHEMSNQSYPELGITDPYHPLTHHQGDPQKIAKALQVNIFHSRMVAYLVEKLRATKDAEGTLLDHSIVIHGSGLSDGNKHLPINLPLVLAGGQALGISGGRHVRYQPGTPLTNLYLTLLDKLNISLERFGDSTGRLSLQGA